MKTPNKIKILVLLILCLGQVYFVVGQQEKTKILIVTGGHDFEKEPFYGIFDSIPSIAYDTLGQPKANQFIASKNVDKYDVLVFYDMYDSIAPAQRKAYFDLLDKGYPMIFLHHTLGAYQSWPDFLKILGGQSCKTPTVVDNDTLLFSYEHDVKIPIHVLEGDNPITKNIDDFEIVDEVYKGVKMLPNIIPLLSTYHPNNMKYVAWINHCGNSDIAYIQLGHGPSAYSNPSFRKLIKQAIEWAANQSNALKSKAGY